MLPLQRSLSLLLILTVIRVDGNQLEVYLLVPLILRRGGIVEDGIPDVLQSSMSSLSLSPLSVVQVDTLPQF